MENLKKKLISSNFEILEDYTIYSNEIELKEETPLNFKEKGNSLIIRDKKNSEMKLNIDSEKKEPSKIITRKKEEKNVINIPERFTAAPGINLMGTCKNEKCVEYEKIVINHIEQPILDLTDKGGIMKCPICQSCTKCDNVVFYHCYYNIYGEKLINNFEKKKFGEKIEDFVHTYIYENNFVFINGKSYQVENTGKKNFHNFFCNDSSIDYIELVFQVKTFDV